MATANLPFETLPKISTAPSFLLRIAVLALMIRASGPEEISGRDHVILQSCNIWDTALSTCRSTGLGRGLPIILKKWDHTFASKQMKSHNISVIWLGLRRQHFEQFIWTDCSPAPADFARQAWPDSLNCAFVNRRENAIDAGKCSTPKGIICEIKDCSQCSVLHCTRIMGRCFYKTCTPMTWEAGRAYCKSRGWDLAVLGSSEDGIQLRVRMVSEWEESPCMFYWIGLRREEWFYPNTTLDGVSSVHWGDGEPGLKGDCAVMMKSGRESEWRAVSCTERHQSLCYRQHAATLDAEGRANITLQSCRSWEAASVICKSTTEGVQLPVITGVATFRSISKLMNNFKVNETWLALKRHHLKKFLWLDCKPAPSDFAAQKWNTTTNCAFINAKYDSLDADSCYSTKGVLCEIKGCHHCSVVGCTLIGRRCFIKTCTAMSWEAARAYCRSSGWDLAVLGSSELGRDIRQTLVSKWKDSPCTSYWIGLRREEWVYPNDGHLKLNRVYWDRSEPKDGGQCSVMIRTRDGHRWRVADCNEKHSSVCVRSSPVIISTSKPWTFSRPPYSKLKSTQYGHVQKTAAGTEKAVIIKTESSLLYGLVPALLLPFITILVAIGVITYRGRIYLKKILEKQRHFPLIASKNQNRKVLYNHLCPEILRKELELRRLEEEALLITEPLITSSLPALNTLKHMELNASATLGASNLQGNVI